MKKPAWDTKSVAFTLLLAPVTIACLACALPIYAITKLARVSVTEPAHRRHVASVESDPAFDPDDDPGVCEALSYKADWLSGILYAVPIIFMAPAILLWEHLNERFVATFGTRYARSTIYRLTNNVPEWFP